MKYLITESKLKNIIFKYYFDGLFKDSFIVEGDKWWGVSNKEVYGSGLIIGYEKTNPKTGYYWGTYFSVDTALQMFSIDRDEFEGYLKQYIKEKYNLEFTKII